MRLATILLLAATGIGSSGQAQAAERTIGLAAPLTDSFARLGEQMRQGAQAATASLSSDQIGLQVADTACNAEGGAAAARNFVAVEVDIVTGFLCTEAIEAALPILTEAGIPVITAGVRTDSLTDNKDKTGWLVFRLAPRADAELEAVATILTERWRDELFAIIDDGTIYARELAEGFRLAAEQAGLSPAYVDTFRPQLENQIALAGRLRKSGATHVFAGGDRDDLAILGRDAAELGMELTIAGGEALRSTKGDVDLPPGALMIGLPDWEDVAEPGVVRSLRDAEIEPDGYVLPAYAAVQVAAAALGMAESGEDSLAEVLREGTFSTAIGSIAFDEKGDLEENPYRLFVYDGQEFQEID